MCESENECCNNTTRTQRNGIVFRKRVLYCLKMSPVFYQRLFCWKTTPLMRQYRAFCRKTTPFLLCTCGILQYCLKTRPVFYQRQLFWRRPHWWDNAGLFFGRQPYFSSMYVWYCCSIVWKRALYSTKESCNTTGKRLGILQRSPPPTNGEIALRTPRKTHCNTHCNTPQRTETRWHRTPNATDWVLAVWLVLL